MLLSTRRLRVVARRASFSPYSPSLFSTDRTAKRLSDGWTLQGVYDFCVRYDILFRHPTPSKISA